MNIPVPRLLSRALAAATMGFAAAPVAEAQVLSKLPPLTGNSVQYGCRWLQTIDHENRNTGYPDTHAEYQVSAVPAFLKAEVGSITYRGKYAKARYFTFSSYDGFRPGNLIDSVQDYQLTPRLNGAPVASPGVLPGPLPDSGAGSYDWQLTLKYTFPPKPPLAREPDTLYLGDTTARYAGASFPNYVRNKQVGYRVYLPDVGEDDFGGVPLPSITYTGTDGTVVDVNNNNPEQASCDQLDNGQDVLLLVFPQVGVSGTQNPKFNILGGLDTLRVYPNGGTALARASINVRYADMTVVRFKAQPTPDRGPNAEVRYVSLCQEQVANSSVVDCIADRNFVVQPDGYITTVISPLATRPALATVAHGYNYIRWGTAGQTLAYLRQILANPEFPGNFNRATGKTGAGIDAILGEWSPDISYCDRDTFAAFADQGGLALIQACKANYKPFRNGVGKPDPN